MKKILIGITILLGAVFISKKYVVEKKFQEKKYTGVYINSFETETFKDDETGQVYWLHGAIFPLIENAEKEREIGGQWATIAAQIKLKGIDEGESHHELSESGDRDLKVIEIIDIISQ